MPWQNVLDAVPLLAGGLAFVIGCMAVIRPRSSAKAFGIAVGTSDSTALGFVVATGARDLYIGLITLLLYWHRDSTLIGINFICIGLVACVDFVMICKKGSRIHAPTHLAGAFLAFGFGIVELLR